MLDAYVIEEIKRRDRDQRREERPAIELPVPPPGTPEPRHGDDSGDDRDRGVVIIDYSA